MHFAFICLLLFVGIGYGFPFSPSLICDTYDRDACLDTCACVYCETKFNITKTHCLSYTFLEPSDYAEFNCSHNVERPLCRKRFHNTEIGLDIVFITVLSLFGGVLLVLVALKVRSYFSRRRQYTPIGMEKL